MFFRLNLKFYVMSNFKIFVHYLGKYLSKNLVRFSSVRVVPWTFSHLTDMFNYGLFTDYLT